MIIEALAHGLPVMCFDHIPSNVLLIKDRINGILVNHHDSQDKNITSFITSMKVFLDDKALRQTKAKLLYVMNLMTKYGQTNDFTAKDHLTELERYVGTNAIDACLVNSSGNYAKIILGRYKEEKAHPVKDDLDGGLNIKVIRRSLMSPKVHIKDKSDKLTRSLVRHDSAKLAKAIMSIV